MRFLAALALLAFAAACQPEIGDNCASSYNCAPNGGRICDPTSPGGYCTIAGCDPNGCPDGAVCVEWLYEEGRTSTTYCMKRCSSTKDCGRGAGYACVHDTDPPDERLVDPNTGEVLARITDFDGRADDGFCAYVRR